MKRNGYENWQLGGVCDRKFAQRKAFSQKEIIEAARAWIRTQYPDSADDTRFQRLGLLIDFVTDLVPCNPDHFVEASKMLTEPSADLRPRCEATWNTCYPDRRPWSDIGESAQAEWLRVFEVFESLNE